MEIQDDDFMAKLEAKLKCLPLWSDKVEREDHWITAEQIKAWSGTTNPDGWNSSDNFIDFEALIDELLSLKVI